MNCALHPEVEATGFCRNCGKALCAQCRRDVRGILYCEVCLADMLARPQPVASGVSPGLAVVLGFIPGLGAVYNGEYMKALIHVVIFAALVTLDSSGRAQPFSGIMTAAFIFYMAIDAYRTAKARMLGQAPPSSALGGWSTDKPIGPIILITLGVIFLLDKYYSFWDWLGDYWSVALIVLGVLMLWKRMGRTS